MDYLESIEKGFELYDEIETEICILKRVDNAYVDVSYADGIFTIKADCRVKEFEAEIIIQRDEILQKVLNENLAPKEAICRLLKEKICISAHEFER